MARKSKFLKWRRKQRRGAIMKPSTFKKIARSSPGGAKAAGAVYWKIARAKFRKRKR